MINIILSFTQCFINFLITYIFLNGIFIKRHKETTWIFLIIGIASIVLTYVNSIKNPVLNTLVMILLLIIILTLVFTSKVIKVCFVSILLVAICVGCEFISIAILSVVAHTTVPQATELIIQSVSLSFISTALFFIISLLAKFVLIKMKSIHANIENQFNISLVLLPIFSIAIAYYVVETGNAISIENNLFVHNLSIIVFLIAVNFIVFACDYDARRKYAYRTQILEMQAQSSMKEALITQQDKNIRETNILVHEFKNQLFALHTLAEKINTSEDREEFLQTASEVTNKLPQIEHFADIHSDFLRCILTKTFAECKNYDIELITTIQFSNFDFISFIDASTIFSNAFDNALTACKERRNKDLSAYISVNIQKLNKIIMVTIENNKVNTIQERKGVIFTTKNDCSKHGIGLLNIKCTIERYNGSMDFSYDDERFTLKLLFMT